MVAHFDWTVFLKRWSEEWLRDEPYRAGAAPECLATGWLGYPGATEEQIAQAEAKLEIALPPSYRAFLKVSNGWRDTSPFIYRLWSTEEIEWLAVRNQDLIEVWTEPGMIERDFWETRYLPNALEVSDWGDSAICILNSQVIRADGEWEAAFFANWNPGADVYGSFQELMEAEYQTFRDLRGRGTA